MCYTIVFAGQQVRILGENFTLEDEEDSKIGQVMLTTGKLHHMIFDNVSYGYHNNISHDHYITLNVLSFRSEDYGCLKQGEVECFIRAVSTHMHTD